VLTYDMDELESVNPPKITAAIISLYSLCN